jgi:lipopolysaccharide heptosyltransferase II
MGDVLMSAPAMRALKQTFQCRITLLTSELGALITPFVPEVDNTMICDIPWVKATGAEDSRAAQQLVQQIQAGRFDCAVIFTVYSQSALPAATLLYMAGVPVRLGYSRENPYGLLTHWVPDQEPYRLIRHQVERDLALVFHLGATTKDEKLAVNYSKESLLRMQQKVLKKTGIAPGNKYLLLHPGVSEVKREYPVDKWLEAVTGIQRQTGLPVLISGSVADSPLVEKIAGAAGLNCYSLAGYLSVEEWIALIANAALVVSVNTATVHVAAAVQTPVVVLYALTNPQHTPWLVASSILPWTVKKDMKSKNEVIRYVDEEMFAEEVPLPDPEQIMLRQPASGYTSRSILFRHTAPAAGFARLN